MAMTKSEYREVLTERAERDRAERASRVEHAEQVLFVALQSRPLSRLDAMSELLAEGFDAPAETAAKAMRGLRREKFVNYSMATGLYSLVTG